MADPGFDNTDNIGINDGDAPGSSSGLDPGVETAIIVNVVVWVFILGLFLFLWMYCRPTRPRRIDNKANKNNSTTNQKSRNHPSLISRFWRTQSHKAEIQDYAAGLELGRRVDGEFAAHGEPEEEQSGERVNPGSLPLGVTPLYTPTLPSSRARNEETEPQSSVIGKLKKIFRAREGKGKGAQGERRRKAGDEESLMGVKVKEEEEEKGELEEVEVEVKKPAKWSTRGSEEPPPPAYESLAEDQQHHKGT
jgi:hypothetical protein